MTRTLRLILFLGCAVLLLVGVVAAVLSETTGALPLDEYLSVHPATSKTVVVVNLNTATRADLFRLDGMTPSVADNILAYRDRHVRFRAVDEILSVKGVTADLFTAWRFCLTV